MPTVDNIQYAFNAGELSPRTRARVDIDKYSTGLATCENALVLPHGPAVRRSGFVYLGEVKTSSKLTRLIPFEFSEDQAYVIEVGDSYARFWMDGGVIVSPDSYTKLLFHMDGVNASNEFEDDGSTVHTVTAYGNAKMTTDDQMFGLSSLICDGNGDYLSIPDHADWDYGTGRITIDFWVYTDNNTGSQVLYYQGDSNSTADHIAIWLDIDTNEILFSAVNADAIVGAEAWTYSTGFVKDTWYHIALIRGWGDSNNEWMACVNGVACAGSSTTLNITMPDHDGALLIGRATDLFVPDVAGLHRVKAVGNATVKSDAEYFGKGSMYFDGTGDYFIIADSADWDITSQTDLTISIFVKHSDHAGVEGYVCQYEDADNQWGFKHVHGTGTRFWFFSGGVTIIDLFGKEIEDTSWHHVALVKTGDDYGMYVDGVLTGWINDNSADTLAGTLRVGMAADSVGTAQYFQGYIDDLIVSHANIFSADPTDFLTDDGNIGHTVSLIGGTGGQFAQVYPDHSTLKWGDSAIRFEGATQYIRLSDHANWDISTNFTIDFWVNHEEAISAPQGYICQEEDNDNWWAFYVGATGILWFQVQSANSNIVSLQSAAGVMTGGDGWHHVALCKVGNLYGIYLDGDQVAYVSDTSTDTFAGNLAIGFMNVGTAWWLDGHMDELRITQADSFGAIPNVGKTDTITIPTGAHSSDANTRLLLHFNEAGITVPITKVAVDSDTKLALRGDFMDLDGGVDEYRVNKGIARWTAAFSYPTSAYPGFQGGTTYEIATTPWSEADLAGCKWAQSADTLYVCNPDYNVYKITRSDHDSWTCTEIDWASPPWQATADCNPNATTIDPDAITGDISLIASDSLFSDLWVDAYIWQANGFYRITAVTDATHASATVKSDLDDHVATATWKLSAWNGITGYPRCITFHEDRLVLAGAGGEPLTIRLSEVGNYENFETSTADSDPLSYEILAQKQNVILWLLGGKKLYIGTAGAEYLMSGEAENTPITPTSVLIQRQSTTGSEDHQPITIGSALLYIQRAGKVVNAWEYDYTTEVYEPSDITILAEHLSNVYSYEEIHYCQDPNRIAWLKRSDGKLVGVTILKEQEVVGWHGHVTTDSTGDGEIESMAVIPGNSQGRQQDELWMIVKRTIDSSSVRYIEMLDIVYDGDSILYHRYMDSCLTYSGNPATSFTGATHLEGEAVIILADGSAITGKTISGGGFTLTDAASEVTVGLAYNTTLALLTPELAKATQSVTSGFQRKRYIKLLLMLYETCQLKYGTDTSNLFDVWDIKGLTDNTLYTENIEVEFDGNPEYDPTCVIRQEQPYGFTLLGVVETIEYEGDK